MCCMRLTRSPALALIAALLICGACQPRAVQTPTAELVATPTPAPPPGLAVEAWVSDPTPPIGSDVQVHFALLNHGIPINALDMSATWQQGGHTQWCHVQVQFDMAQCPISVTGFQPGVYVPITVSVEYVGWIFYGYTGFTPR